MGTVRFNPVLDDRHYAVFIEGRGDETGSVIYPSEEAIEIHLDPERTYDIFIPMPDGTEKHYEVAGTSDFNISAVLPNIQPKMRSLQQS